MEDKVMRHSQWYLIVSSSPLDHLHQKSYGSSLTACGTSGSRKSSSEKDEETEQDWEKETTAHISKLHQLLFNYSAKTSGAHFIECGSTPGLVDLSARTLDDAILTNKKFAQVLNLEISFGNF